MKRKSDFFTFIETPYVDNGYEGKISDFSQIHFIRKDSLIRIHADKSRYEIDYYVDFSDDPLTEAWRTEEAFDNRVNELRIIISGEKIIQ